MSREPTALREARETLMENSALAMEEQRHGLEFLTVARRLRHAIRRMATEDGVLSRLDLDAIRLADRLVSGCEISLALDVRDEEMLRGANRALDRYSRQVCSHTRHEPPTEAARP